MQYQAINIAVKGGPWKKKIVSGYENEMDIVNSSIFCRYFERPMVVGKDEFIVITRFMSPNALVDLLINKTFYLTNPDGSQIRGIDDSGPVRIYLRPGMTWDFLIHGLADMPEFPSEKGYEGYILKVWYEIYTGTESYLAEAVAYSGDQVNPQNVEHLLHNVHELHRMLDSYGVEFRGHEIVKKIGD